MESETGAFTQLQKSKRASRRTSGIWRAEEASRVASRSESVRDSVRSVADMWAQGRYNSSDANHTSLERNSSATLVAGTGKSTRRWDGIKRATTDWDEIRRDPELWFPDGDCLIYLYGRGSSRRGPSLRVHCEDLEEAGFRHIMSKFADIAMLEEAEEKNSSPDEDDGGFQSNPKMRGKEEMYIPVPPLLNRDEATKFHLTTRNFFAFIYEKPVVGTHLGEALVLLHERINQYRPDKERNLDQMLEYIDGQGYTDFRDCPDHAMAIMTYAERLRETDLWTEAFVHCVGMYDILNSAIEFPTITRTIGALITRAHLEMTLRLEHAFADLGNFMEDSISSAFPKLPDAATKHLERFRSFLNSFYVQQHGYWPPPSLQLGADYSIVTKSLLRSMYTDMRNLYLFLCDPKSEPKPTQAQIETYKAIYGGVCTPALIGAFDRRFKHTPLPYPLPLLPSSVSGKSSPMNGHSVNLAAMNLSESSRPSSGSAFSRFLRPSKRKSAKALNTLNMLTAATNSNNPAIMDSMLVQEYSRFERDWTVRGEEKIGSSEARKVRWLLIYALLQTLIGVIATPIEVEGTDKVEYPLCVQTGGTPPWKKRMKTKAMMNGTATPMLEALSAASSVAGSPYLTPKSIMTPSGVRTPIESPDAVPPVPQLALSELEKLNRSHASLNSSTSISQTPAPPVNGHSDDSGRSTSTIRPGKTALKSSSDSIKSDRSTRSSFGSLINRSLYIGPIGLAGSQTSLASNPHSQSVSQNPSQAPTRLTGPEPPQVQQHDSAPSQTKLAKRERSSNRSSIFGNGRSSTRSDVPDPGNTTSPNSPVQSAFSKPRESVRAGDFHDSNLPTPTTSGFSDVAATNTTSQPETVVPRSPTVSEPERGRSLNASFSPSHPDTSAAKGRILSRGRSAEWRSPIPGRSDDTPPPVPTTTKPRSAATSPIPSPRTEIHTHKDSGTPPPMPPSTKPRRPAASPARESYHDSRTRIEPSSPPSMPNHTNPQSTATSSLRTVEVDSQTSTNATSPPPMPIHTKPHSRGTSPSRAANVDSQAYYHNTNPPPLPISSKPQTRTTSPIGSPRSGYKQRGRNETATSTTSTMHGREQRSPQVQEKRLISRSLALRPAGEQPPIPQRPISNVSVSTDSAEDLPSGSVSPKTDAPPSPNTSAEMLRGTQNTPSRHLEPYAALSPGAGAAVSFAHEPSWANPAKSSFHAALRDHDAGRSSQRSYQQQQQEEEQEEEQEQRPRRGSSRESKYRRAAWAQLGSGLKNNAYGMQVPPMQIRQYGSPILRDAPPQGFRYDGSSEFDGQEDESEV